MFRACPGVQVSHTRPEQVTAAPHESSQVRERCQTKIGVITDNLKHYSAGRGKRIAFKSTFYVFMIGWFEYKMEIIACISN